MKNKEDIEYIGEKGTGLNKSIDNSTFELIVMGYARISPIRRSWYSAPHYYTGH